MNRKNARVSQLSTNAVQNVKSRIDAYPAIVAFFLPIRFAKMKKYKGHWKRKNYFGKSMSFFIYMESVMMHR